MLRRCDCNACSQDCPVRDFGDWLDFHPGELGKFNEFIDRFTDSVLLGELQTGGVSHALRVAMQVGYIKGRMHWEIPEVFKEALNEQ